MPQPRPLDREVEGLLARGVIQIHRHAPHEHQRRVDDRRRRRRRQHDADSLLIGGEDPLEDPPRAEDADQQGAAGEPRAERVGHLQPPSCQPAGPDEGPGERGAAAGIGADAEERRNLGLRGRRGGSCRGLHASIRGGAFGPGCFEAHAPLESAEFSQESHLSAPPPRNPSCPATNPPGSSPNGSPGGRRTTRSRPPASPGPGRRTSSTCSLTPAVRGSTSGTPRATPPPTSSPASSG